MMSRLTRSMWATIIFMGGFALLVWAVSDQFLIPAVIAARDATPGQKRQLMAHARLLLAVVLFVLCVVLFLVFRIRRFFIPKGSISPRQKTQYIDAWAEAGRRTQPPSDESP